MKGAIRPLVAAALALALAWPSAALAEPTDPRARKRLDEGQAALARDDYEQAIARYEEALAIEREPKVLYLLGQAEFLRGRCRASVRYFKQVKEFEVSPEVESAMRPYLAECAERLAEEPDAVPVPEPGPDVLEPVPEELEPIPDEESIDNDPPSARRWYQDPLGDALVAVGLVGSATGASLLVVARRQRTTAGNYGELEERADMIGTLRIAGMTTLGVGAALMIGGFVRWGVVARQSPQRPASARFGVLLDGETAGVSVTGRF